MCVCVFVCAIGSGVMVVGLVMAWSCGDDDVGHRMRHLFDLRVGQVLELLQVLQHHQFPLPTYLLLLLCGVADVDARNAFKRAQGFLV